MKKKREENPVVNRILTPEFLKHFKDPGELNFFMENLYARAMEQ
jgi:putative transposase